MGEKLLLASLQEVMETEDKESRLLSTKNKQTDRHYHHQPNWNIEFSEDNIWI